VIERDRERKKNTWDDCVGKEREEEKRERKKEENFG
jgi:hypothetical protein